MGTNNDVKPDDGIVITNNSINEPNKKSEYSKETNKINIINDKRIISLQNNNESVIPNNNKPTEESLNQRLPDQSRSNDCKDQTPEQQQAIPHSILEESLRGKKDNANEAVQCIFLCEFHVTQGRRIAVQVPEDFITKKRFETVSRYVIPQVQLQRSFLSVSLLGIKILGYPVRIDNQHYARNAFYFNVCFVFEPTTRTIGYEPVVRKLSEYLLAMEHSCRILSHQYSPIQMARLTRLLTQVRDDINSKKTCMLQEGSTLIPLCVVPRYPETVKVYPHDAAALTDEFYKYVGEQWDLTTSRILPYIDGFNHVNRITALADVAVELVCDCIKHLVILGVAVIVPVFQYGNVYRPTPKLSQLAKCRDLQKKCIQRCSKSERKRASVRDIFRIFASMAHGATFGELCVRFNPAALNINERQMVLFGLLEGLIRRVDKYPVTISRNLFAVEEDDITKPKLGPSGTPSNTPTFETMVNSSSPPNSQTPPSSKPLPRGGRALRSSCNSNNCQIGNSEPRVIYNGLKSFDEISCTTGMSCQQLDAYLARDEHVIVLLK